MQLLSCGQQAIAELPCSNADLLLQAVNQSTCSSNADELPVPSALS